MTERSIIRPTQALRIVPVGIGAGEIQVEHKRIIAVDFGGRWSSSIVASTQMGGRGVWLVSASKLQRCIILRQI